jgi:hypothetical protein
MTTIRRRRVDLVAVALRLTRLLGSDDCVVIGTLAVGIHGFVRAPTRLDLMSRRPLARVRKTLREAGIKTCVRRGDVLDSGLRWVEGEIDAIPFDILPPLVPIAWEAAIRVDVRGGALRAVDLDGLLWLKFRAGGPLDLLDAARLVMLHPEAETRAQELATAYRALDRFDIWLRDPRIRAQAQEEARRERRAVRPGSKRTGAKVPQPKRPRKPSDRARARSPSGGDGRGSSRGTRSTRASAVAARRQVHRKNPGASPIAGPSAGRDPNGTADRSRRTPSRRA